MAWRIAAPPACGGGIALGDFRVEALGHRIDIIRLVHRKQDRVPQELVAFDVGWHPDLMQDLGHGQLIAVYTGMQHPFILPQSSFQHPAGKHSFIKWFDKIVGKSFIQQLLHHLLALESTGDKNAV